LQRLGRSCSLQ